MTTELTNQMLLKAGNVFRSVDHPRRDLRFLEQYAVAESTYDCDSIAEQIGIVLQAFAKAPVDLQQQLLAHAANNAHN